MTEALLDRHQILPDPEYSDDARHLSPTSLPVHKRTGGCETRIGQSCIKLSGLHQVSFEFDF